MSNKKKKNPYTEKILQEIQQHVKLKMGEELLYLHNHFKDTPTDLKTMLNEKDTNVVYLLTLLMTIPILFGTFDDNGQPQEIYESSMELKAEVAMDVLEGYLQRNLKTESIKEEVRRFISEDLSPKEEK